jgi:hypothetical protein
MPDRNDAPPTAEENERVDRQPGVKGHPRQPGAAKNSPERQREAEPDPADRRSPSGLLDVEHGPGPRDHPTSKP